MKKQLAIAICLGLVLTATAIVQIPAHPENDPYVTDLIAGQHIDAGDVLVWNDGDEIHVIYETTGGWEITESHLYVGKNIPPTSAPGQFPYDDPDESTSTRHSYVIPLEEIDGYHKKLNNQGKPVGPLEADGDPGVESGDDVFIAAHAVVCAEMSDGCDLEGLQASLPDYVEVKAKHAVYIPAYDEAYFRVIISGGTSIDGTYPGWCVDLDSYMHDNVEFLAKVYSSLETIPAGLLGIPENLDLVNYIINQDYIGQTSAGCGGVYNFGDVQRAIWKLIDEHPYPDTSWLGPLWSMCRAEEIVDDAEANGEGFVPNCEEGDVLGIILQPVNSRSLEQDLSVGQILMIGIPIPHETKEGCETAWGDGIELELTGNWAMYFEYTIQ